MVKNFSRGRVDPSLDFNTDFCLKSAVGAQDFPYCTQVFSAKRTSVSCDAGTSMPASGPQQARRALVKVLLTLAAKRNLGAPT